MTEQAKEPLSVEEPTKVVEAKPETDIDSLVSELERAGVTNVEDLTGKLEASQQSGRLAQLLGDERKRTEGLEAKVRELETKPAPKQDFMDYPEERPIDIEAAIERSVSKVFTDREKQAQIVQEQNLKKWNFIQSDDDYGLIKEIWDTKLKDPNFVYQIQSGLVDPIQEYNSTKVGYYKTLLKKSHETLKTLHGTGKVEPPHLESGERSSANIVSTEQSGTAEEKRIAELKAKTGKGHVLTNEEELEMIDLLFGTKAPL